jgi:2-iminobutanoate/2-iminopropanoate deaminase
MKMTQGLERSVHRIRTTGAPQAIGAYVQATAAEGRFVFISGQLPLDPVGGEIVAGDIEQQVKQSMNNLGEILKEAGLSFQSLVKTTVYVTDMSLFPVVNRAYASFFPDGKYPARAVVEVSALPRGCQVEIEGIAVG